jgi:hypothetical protein
MGCAPCRNDKNESAVGAVSSALTFSAPLVTNYGVLNFTQRRPRSTGCSPQRRLPNLPSDVPDLIITRWHGKGRRGSSTRSSQVGVRKLVWWGRELSTFEN